MINKLVKQFKKNLLHGIGSEFFRNTAKLTSGATLAQLVSIGTAPILYRIYDKDHYGTLGYYMTIAVVIGAISTLQYLQSIIIEEDEFKAKELLWLNRLINLTFSIIVFLLILFFHDFWIQLLKTPELSGWIYLLPFSVFFAGQNEIYRVWANRKKKYGILAQNSILTALLVPCISITIGLLHKSALGLFMGYLASQIIPAIILSFRIGRQEKFSLKGINIYVLWSNAKKYKKFPLYNLPSDLINRITNSLPVLMLGQFSNVGAIGVYNLCARILGLPLSLLTSSIGEVFKQRATQDYIKKGNFHSLFLKTVGGTSAMTIIPIAISLLFAPELFAWVFGEEWTESGILAQYLIVYFMVKFVVSPVSYTIIINRRLHIGLWKNCISLLITFSVFYFGFNYYKYGYIEVIVTFGLTYAILDLIYLAYLSYLSRENLENSLKTQLS